MQLNHSKATMKNLPCRALRFGGKVFIFFNKKRVENCDIQLFCILAVLNPNPIFNLFIPNDL